METSEVRTRGENLYGTEICSGLAGASSTLALFNAKINISIPCAI